MRGHHEPSWAARPEFLVRDFRREFTCLPRLPCNKKAPAFTMQHPSAQRLPDSDRLIGRSRVESRFPHRDLAVAHGPDLDPESLHRLAGFGILPFAVPDVRHEVARQRAKLLVETISLLSDASCRE